MIQDIYPHVMHNQFVKEAKISDTDKVLNIVNGRILLHDERLQGLEIIFPAAADFCGKYDYIYLFSIDNIRYYLLRNELSADEIPTGFSYVEERSLRVEGMGSDEALFATITGKHLADWYRDSQFCGRCGSHMKHSENERAMVCTECGYTTYPRIMPAVIVGVINKNKLLITKYRTGFAHNALIAGFTEIGETAEETVAREVMEEAGVKVKNIRYYKSQPWGTANDLLLGFYCDLDGDERIQMDNSELKFAQWLTPEEIELQPGNFSLTNEMMRLFKEGKVLPGM